ncbi:hypothetical protein PTKIN_Ptkin14bG0195300 [Pterospermum kingtungense]
MMMQGNIQESKLNFINTKSLTLEGIMGDDQNLIPEVDREGLNELTVLHLRYSDSVEYLVDTTKEHVPHTACATLVELALRGMGGLKRLCNGKFPKRFLQNLEILRVEFCHQLEEVFEIDEFCYSKEQNQPHLLKGQPHLLKGSPTYFSLQSLKVVYIKNCEKLKSIFSPSLIQSLILLEELEIEGCNELKTVFTELENDGGETESCSHDLHPLCLPRQENQAPLLSNLEYLELESVPELRWILKGPNQYVNLTNLKVVRIEECNKLESLFSFSLIQTLRLLKKLCISDCDKLEMVFAELESNDETESKRLPVSAQSDLPHLQELQLGGLTNLSSFVPVGYHLLFPSLKELEIKYCSQMITSFTIDSVSTVHAKTKHLVDTKSLEIRYKSAITLGPLPLPPYVEEEDEI